MTVNPQGDLKNHIRFIAEYEDGSSDVFAVPECTCAEPHPSSAPLQCAGRVLQTKLPRMRSELTKSMVVRPNLHQRNAINLSSKLQPSRRSSHSAAWASPMDAVACGRFDGGHFGHGGRFTGNFHDHGRRVFSRSPSYGDEDSGRTGCRCTELSCCDGGD